MHTSLLKVEGAYEAYEAILSKNRSQPEPHAHEVCSNHTIC